LPPAPEIPPIPKGPPTPSAIVGIVSIPDALRVSTAYQTADKVFNDRHKQLDEDAQKEQAALRDLGQQLANDRPKLSPEQIRQRERELQDRIADSRRKFGDRNRVIQEAGQYVMAQINRTMEQVVQQVALARGINVVLNRAQVLGTTADFDLTPQVAEVLNKVLPSVVIPPDGVSPLAMTPPKSEPGAPEAAKPVVSARPATAPTKPTTAASKH
jgi:Skp family chaperone for outer membrane proteins